MSRAAYAVLLKRADSSLTLDAIAWDMPVAVGWALIHAANVMHGEPMIWPQIERSELGRQFLKIESRIRAARKARGLPVD